MYPRRSEAEDELKKMLKGHKATVMRVRAGGYVSENTGEFDCLLALFHIKRQMLLERITAQDNSVHSIQSEFT